MPRVFVYEYLTALGLGRDPASPEHSLYREGRAMRDAVAEDFGRIPGVEVVTVNEVRPGEEEAAVERAAVADFAIVIAPEFDHVLETRYRWIKPGVQTLIGPRIDGIRISVDKLAVSEIWTRNSIPTPRTYTDEDWPSESFPIVCKPQNGAGSIGICLIRSHSDLARIREVVDEYEDATLYQDFIPGRPASVAFLIGEQQTIPLLPTFQRLSSDGRFRYLGGELPIPPALAERAVRLGRRAVECVNGLAGYVGVDLVLGDAADGSQDYAIEINPRLTTSYVGLRALADFNIAEAMLNLATGQPPPEIRWKPGRVRFEPDGKVFHDPTPGAVWP